MFAVFVYCLVFGVRCWLSLVVVRCWLFVVCCVCVVVCCGVGCGVLFVV